jgi:hypothetical protein
MWRKESHQVQERYRQMAEMAKQEHMKQYPEYKYRPRPPRKKKPTKGITAALPVYPSYLQATMNDPQNGWISYQPHPSVDADQVWKKQRSDPVETPPIPRQELPTLPTNGVTTDN